MLTGEIFQELLRRLAAGAKDSGSTLVDRDCGDYNAVRNQAWPIVMGAAFCDLTLLMCCSG